MVSQTDPKTIELYGYGCQHEEPAEAVITPGHLVERIANGNVQAHGTAGGAANTHFATEYALTGRSIDDDYAAGDNVLFSTYQPGSGVYALVASGTAAIADGALLQSNGDGTLATAGVDSVAVAQALEDVDNSGGSNPVRIRVEVVPAFRTAAA